MGVMIAIGQGKFHIKNNGLKYTNTWQWLILSTLFFCLELPQNCLKSHNFKKVGGFETTRLWELLDQKLVFLAIIYLDDMTSYLKLPFRNPHHVQGVHPKLTQGPEICY